MMAEGETALAAPKKQTYTVNLSGKRTFAGTQLWRALDDSSHPRGNSYYEDTLR
jgi:hypothetical protein